MRSFVLGGRSFILLPSDCACRIRIISCMYGSVISLLFWICVGFFTLGFPILILLFKVDILWLCGLYEVVLEVDW